jgi:hypothetical protein
MAFIFVREIYVPYNRRTYKMFLEATGAELFYIVIMILTVMAVIAFIAIEKILKFVVKIFMVAFTNKKSCK